MAPKNSKASQIRQKRALDKITSIFFKKSSMHLAKHCLISLLMVSLIASWGCSNKSSRPNHAEYDNFFDAHNHNHISIHSLQTLHQVKRKILRTASLDVEFKLSANREPNAFATMINSKPHIIVNIGLLQLIGNDKNEYAFIIAHECAHIAKKHFEGKKNISRTGGRSRASLSPRENLSALLSACP